MRSAAAQRGTLEFGPFRWPCALGRSGIRAVKREGDGASPRGSYAVLRIFYRPDKFRRSPVAVPAAAVAEVLPLPVPADPNAPGPFAFADAERVAGILTAAGFRDPALEPVAAKVWVGDTPEEAAAYLRTTGMGRAIFADAAPELIDEALARAATAVAPHAGPDGIELDGAAWLVSATA